MKCQRTLKVILKLTLFASVGAAVAFTPVTAGLADGGAV